MSPSPLMSGVSPPADWPLFSLIISHPAGACLAFYSFSLIIGGLPPYSLEMLPLQRVYPENPPASSPAVRRDYSGCLRSVSSFFGSPSRYFISPWRHSPSFLFRKSCSQVPVQVFLPSVPMCFFFLSARMSTRLFSSAFPCSRVGPFSQPRTWPVALRLSRFFITPVGDLRELRNFSMEKRHFIFLCRATFIRDSYFSAFMPENHFWHSKQLDFSVHSLFLSNSCCSFSARLKHHFVAPIP